MKRHVSYSKNGKSGKKQKLTENAGGISRKKAKEKKHQEINEANEMLKQPDIFMDNVKEDAFADLMKSLKSNKQIVKTLLSSKNDIEDLTCHLTEVIEVEKSSKEETNDTDNYSNNEEKSESSSDEEEMIIKETYASNLTYEDPFKVHFENQLREEQVKKDYVVTDIELNKKYACKIYIGAFDNVLSQKNLLQQACIKQKLIEEWSTFNKVKSNKKGCMTELQKQLFTYIASYKDILFTDRLLSNGEEIRRLYCLHAVNHVLKSRSQVKKNNAKLAASESIGDFRDQGLTRPKVLMLVPFKDSCLKIVNNLIKLVLGNRPKVQVMQKKRFNEEFSKDPCEKQSKAERSEDFKTMFQGNTDDDFKVGVAVAKNTIKLYAPFYHADIIIASPLGLRRIIATEGEKQDFDFLSCIEIVIMDQIDVFSMQNWEHVILTKLNLQHTEHPCDGKIEHVFDYMNLTPRQSHDADFSRVRMWCVDGLSKFYRQSLLFSSIQSAEIHDYNGKMKIALKEVNGAVEQVATCVPQIYQRFKCSFYSQCADMRFIYFINKVLPDFKSQLCYSTAVFIPSYFDFIRIRNHFKKEELSFVQISELSLSQELAKSSQISLSSDLWSSRNNYSYMAITLHYINPAFDLRNFVVGVLPFNGRHTSEAIATKLDEYSKRSNISRSRTLFGEKKKHFILLTERFYFFYRYKIRGIKHIIFYDLPQYPNFYAEFLNFMESPSDGCNSNLTSSCNIIFSNFDGYKLEAILGTTRCKQMITSKKDLHMIVSGKEF